MKENKRRRKWIKAALFLKKERKVPVLTFHKMTV
jgi:hypothetical protein